jgi:DNA-binding beta-propeller fold protein YncE
MYTFLLLLFPLVLSAQHFFVETIHSSSLDIDDAMVLDKEGNLYGSHYMGNAVYKLSPDGTLKTFASGFDTPNGLAFNSAEELYIVDNRGNRIYKLDKSGNFLDTISIINPSGIIKAIDSDTMIFTHYMGNHISKLAPDGRIISWHSGGLLNGPVGLCYDDSSNLYVGNFTDREIYRVKESSLEYVATIPGPTFGSQRFLGFITFANGWIYGTSFNLDRIYRVHPGYVDSVEWFSGHGRGNLDGHFSVATFNQPNGIYASPTGDTLYVSDFGTGNVRMITLFSTAIEDDITEQIFTISPNPCTDKIQIKTQEMMHRANLTIYNQMGRKMMEQRNLIGNNFHLDITELASGVYMAVLHSEGKISQKRIIKE